MLETHITEQKPLENENGDRKRQTSKWAEHHGHNIEHQEHKDKWAWSSHRNSPGLDSFPCWNRVPKQVALPWQLHHHLQQAFHTHQQKIKFKQYWIKKLHNQSLKENPDPQKAGRSVFFTYKRS